MDAINLRDRQFADDLIPVTSKSMLVLHVSPDVSGGRRVTRAGFEKGANARRKIRRGCFLQHNSFEGPLGAIRSVVPHIKES